MINEHLPCSFIFDNVTQCNVARYLKMLAKWHTVCVLVCIAETFNLYYWSINYDDAVTSVFCGGQRTYVAVREFNFSSIKQKPYMKSFEKKYVCIDASKHCSFFELWFT